MVFYLFITIVITFGYELFLFTIFYQQSGVGKSEAGGKGGLEMLRIEHSFIDEEQGILTTGLYLIVR